MKGFTLVDSITSVFETAHRCCCPAARAEIVKELETG